ncbi:hypothetical protein [Desulfonema magnum]|uniref:Uncharacterized protein n=1 Tax=Desulfonema magnum TaxID=45655 RepID=A0A975C090_9BACT|nr:hypothetical protein [Desulfonema magnum]QTA93805.1 Uncharacterized protein dnm_099130 [Desulfonema magnum]
MKTKPEKEIGHIRSTEKNIEKPERIFLWEGDVIKILSKQATVKLLETHPPFADLKVILPNLRISRLENITSGARRQYEYNGEPYYFDVLKIRNGYVEIAITERQ